MNHVVSQRFIQCVVELKRRNVVRSARQFALQVNHLPQSLNEILKGRRDVTIDLIHKSVNTFQFNPHYLFNGEGPLFSFEAKEKGLRIHTVVTDNEGLEQIVHVPIPAQSRYVSNALTSKALKDLTTYTLPGIEGEEGSHRSFEVKGDAMHPTIEATDVLVCESIDPSDWRSAVRDDQIYVFVSNSGVLVMRAINRLEMDGLLQLHADNPSYKPFLVHEEEIREIWKPKFILKRFIQQVGYVSLTEVEDETDLQEALAKQQRILEQVQEQIQDLMNHRKNSA